MKWALESVPWRTSFWTARRTRSTGATVGDWAFPAAGMRAKASSRRPSAIGEGVDLVGVSNTLLEYRRTRFLRCDSVRKEPLVPPTPTAAAGNDLQSRLLYRIRAVSREVSP